MPINYQGGSFDENLIETGNVIPSFNESAEAYETAMNPVWSQEEENRNTEVEIAGQDWDKLKHFSQSLEAWVTPKVDAWIAEAETREENAADEAQEAEGREHKKAHDKSLETQSNLKTDDKDKKGLTVPKKDSIPNYGAQREGKPLSETSKTSVAELGKEEKKQVEASSDLGKIKETVFRQTNNVFASESYSGLDHWAKMARQKRFIRESIAGYNLDEIGNINDFRTPGAYFAARNQYKDSHLNPILKAYKDAGLKPNKAFLKKYFHNPIARHHQEHLAKWQSNINKSIRAGNQATRKQDFQGELLTLVARDYGDDIKTTTEKTANAVVERVMDEITLRTGHDFYGDVSAARGSVFDDLVEMAGAGGLKREVMNSLREGLFDAKDGSKQKIPKYYYKEWQKVEEAYQKWVKHDNQVASNNKKQVQRDFNAETIENMPEDIKEREAYLNERQSLWKDSTELGAGQENKHIKHLMDSQTQTGNLVKEYTDRANYLQEIDLLTVKYLMRPEVPISVRQAFMEEAKRQDGQRALDPYNEDKFTKMAADDVMPDNKQDSSIEQVGVILHKRYKEIAKDLHINNVPNAYQEAYDRVDEWWKENNTNYKTLHGYDYKKLRGDANRTSGMFRRKGIVNLTKLEKETTNRLTAKLHDLGGKVLTTKVETRGDGLIDTAVASFEEIEDMSKGFGKPEFTIDPKLYWLSNHLRDEDGHKIHPITALNQLRETVGLPSLGTTDSEILFNSLNPVAQYDVMNNSQNSQDVKARVYWGSDVNGRLVSSEKKLKAGSQELVKFKQSLLPEEVGNEVDNIVKENNLPTDNTFPTIYRMIAEGVDVTGIEIPGSDSWRDFHLYKMEMTEDPKEYEFSLQQLIDPALAESLGMTYDTPYESLPV